ncbi:MAG TPA: 4Fe-4S binding protein [Anaerolineaceae bacterium]|nr:4Fe-4S binding protein [Anaerolineaceae bacterium]
MKQLVILSGKGGTGKTSISAAFAHLVNCNPQAPAAILVDADVDAANLSLIMQPNQSEPHDFWGGSLAEIDREACTGCGACIQVCRYDAILPDSNDPQKKQIDPVACDGCAACIYACPEGAIRMVPQQEGIWFQSQTPYGTLFHAELLAGRENSGKLVTLVKQHARLMADDGNVPLVILDGPPGIGCPVISACAGSDYGLVVTEPSLSGIHDLKRAIGMLQHFHIPAAVCINKADIYPEGASLIKEYAESVGINVVGEIPYDQNVLQSMLQARPITEIFPSSPSAIAIRNIWIKLASMLLENRES